MSRLRPCAALIVGVLLAACVQPQPIDGVQPVGMQASLPPAPLYPSQPYPESQLASPPYPADPKPTQPAAPLATGWRPVAQPLTESLAGGGATHVAVRATNGDSSVELELVVFDSHQCGIRVIDQPQPGAGGSVIASAMRAHRAVAGVNGGFFTPEFRPLGLMITGEKRTGSIEKTNLLGGMFLSAGGQPRLIWRNEYSGDKGVTDLMQAGPRLVDSGVPVGGLAANASRDRTFIATDGRHLWAVGVAKSASLAALADLLASPGIIPHIRVRRALNLDGGNSSAIWMRTAQGKEISEPGWSTVRNFIAIIPK